MEFGKLEQLHDVNWSLPPDDPLSLSFLQNLPKDHEFQIYLGAPAWGHKEWIGRVYPPKTKSTDFLFHYSRKFSCIELNTTHYQIPTPDKTGKWLSQVPEGFLFCPKLYQGISHSPNGLLDVGLLQEWYAFLKNLGANRGPCFIQFSPHFDYSFKALLFRFLRQWPTEFELCLELRHPSWFQGGKVLPALTQYLQTQGMGLVITDVAGRRDVLHTSISADFLILRFIGNDLDPSDFDRAKEWSERFAKWKSQGLNKIFLIVHEPSDLHVPEMAQFFVEQLNECMDLGLRFDLVSTDDPQISLLSENSGIHLNSNP
jgi:uncharacterized protein YecE (DUF72 family)